MGILNWKFKETRYEQTSPKLVRTPDGRKKVVWKSVRPTKASANKRIWVTLTGEEYAMFDELAKHAHRTIPVLATHIIKSWMEAKTKAANAATTAPMIVVEIPFTEDELSVIDENDLVVKQNGKFAGVCPKNRRWAAQINTNKTIYHLGLYKTETLAGKAFLYAKMLVDVNALTNTKIAFVSRKKHV